MSPSEIKALFETFGTSIDKDDVWSVQSATVIKHKALERLAAAAKIEFERPQVLRAERDEAVILVVGKLKDRCEWSIGEALVNANYRVSGRQAAYVYAMAEKRAKDRVILKLAGLHGLYSEDEADEFKESAPVVGRNSAGADVARTSAAPAERSQAYLISLGAMKMSRSRAELRDWFLRNKENIAASMSEAESMLLVGERNALALTLPEKHEEAA